MKPFIKTPTYQDGLSDGIDGKLNNNGFESKDYDQGFRDGSKHFIKTHEIKQAKLERIKFEIENQKKLKQKEYENELPRLS